MNKKIQEKSIGNICYGSESKVDHGDVVALVVEHFHTLCLFPLALLLWLLLDGE